MFAMSWCLGLPKGNQNRPMLVSRALCSALHALCSVLCAALQVLPSAHCPVLVCGPFCALRACRPLPLGAFAALALALCRPLATRL